MDRGWRWVDAIHPYFLAQICPLRLIDPLFLQHLWSTCCIPGMVLGAKVTEMTRIQLLPWGAYGLEWEAREGDRVVGKGTVVLLRE